MAELIEGNFVIHSQQSRSTLIEPPRPLVTAYDRAQLSGHLPLCVWLTGLSGAGKTTLAQGTEKRLHARGVRTAMLDGDQLRSDLCRDLDFSPEGRSENLRRASILAHYLSAAGTLVFCAFVSPHAIDRARARALFAPGLFFEVYVKCSIGTCRRRDVKGLYRRSDAGELKGLTGVDAVYEEPQTADLVLDTDLLQTSSAIDQLESYLIARIK